MLDSLRADLVNPHDSRRKQCEVRFVRARITSNRFTPWPKATTVTVKKSKSPRRKNQKPHLPDAHVSNRALLAEFPSQSSFHMVVDFYGHESC